MWCMVRRALIIHINSTGPLLKGGAEVCSSLSHGKILCCHHQEVSALFRKQDHQQHAIEAALSDTTHSIDMVCDSSSLAEEEEQEWWYKNKSLQQKKDDAGTVISNVPCCKHVI
mmetsp:Transcript_7504/g.12238  ORF Transcript_7504/g.12238 Transcript_7504/m.12238 type:complete len:114 (+) Transcript_7504:211-552(+)